jgi:hypothetical protein
MKKIISFILSLFLVGCSVKVDVDMNDYSIDIIEDEITLEIGESYRLTVRAPLGEYSWNFKEGVECVTFDSNKDIVKGVSQGKVLLEAYNSKGYKDEVIINVLKTSESIPDECNYGYYYDFNELYSSNGSCVTYFKGVGYNNVDYFMGVNLEDYGITNLIGGDSIKTISFGAQYLQSIAPAGGLSFEGELVDIIYYPSVIYEVTLEKREMYEDSIGIGLNSSLGDFKLINNFVVSKDENGRLIKKDLEEYDDNTKLYYSFNQLMNDPHVYSFLYDYNPRG